MNDNRSAYDSDVYDKNIVSTLPYYREFHEQVTDLVRAYGIRSPRWLDTGCGTGTLAGKVISAFPDVSLTLCDPSENMLAIAKKKLEGHDIRFLCTPSDTLPFENEFDVVTAIQCHHYYGRDGREKAVRRCFDALRDGGIFITFENIRMSSEKSDAAALKRWEMFLEKNLGAEEAKRHTERRGKEVFPITMEEHLSLLRGCGFRSADILWTSYLQAGFWAVKKI